MYSARDRHKEISSFLGKKKERKLKENCLIFCCDKKKSSGIFWKVSQALGTKKKLKKKNHTEMDRMQSNYNYQRSCVVISGDILEDWKYVFRELKTRVGVSICPFDND